MTADYRVLPPAPPDEEPVPPAELPLSLEPFAVELPDGFGLLGPPSLAVPVDALLPDGDGLVVDALPDVLPLRDGELDCEPGTLDGLRLLGPPSLAVPLEALLPDGELMPPPEPPLVEPLPPAELLASLPLLELPMRPPDDAAACTPSESSVCWSRPDAPLRLFWRWYACSAARVRGPIIPSTGPGLWPLSARACCTCRTVSRSIVAAEPCVPLMPPPERSIVDPDIPLPVDPVVPLAVEPVVLLAVDPDVPLELLSPAANTAGADASAIQASAAAIGVRLSFMSCSFWTFECDSIRTARGPGTVSCVGPMQWLFPRSGKSAAFVAAHLLGHMVRSNIQLALVLLVLAASRPGAMRLARLGWPGSPGRPGFVGIDLRAPIRVLHCPFSA